MLASVDDWTLEATDVNGRRWAQLLQDHPHLLFHEPAWARVLADGFDCPIDGLLLRCGDQTVGGLLGMRLRRLGLEIGYFGFPYGGVVGRVPIGKTLAELLRSYARQRGISQLKLIGFPGEAVGESSGFVVAADETQLLSLEGQDSHTIMSTYSQNVRRDIHRAERQGVSVRQDTSPAAVDRFCDLYEAVMRRRQAIARYPRQLFQAVVRGLQESDRVRLMLADHDQRTVAGILVVDSAAASHYLMGGSLEDAAPARPNHLLFHRAILRALDKGYDAFDFLPSGHDNPGLRQFKSKWGARPVALSNRRLDVHPVRCAILNAGYACARWKPARKLFERVYRGR